MMALISQNCNFDKRAVLFHPSKPIPWALGASDETLWKTKEASLGNDLEKLAIPVNIIPTNSACIVNRMIVAQNMKGNHTTFDELYL